MNKSLSLFALVTAVSVLLAWLVVQSRSPETVLEKQALYPDLASQLSDVEQIEIQSADHHTVLKAENDQWVLENKGGYPANMQRIRPLVLSLSALQIREAKTANPERYSRLQVEDVDAEKAESRRITLKNAQGDVIADLLVGKDRLNKTTGSIDSLYVRKADDAQSYLVSGEVIAAADPADWVDNQVIDIAPEGIASIEITQAGDQSVSLTRTSPDDIDYTLANIPEGYKTKSQTTIKSIASAIQGLRFDDVNAAADFTWPKGTIDTQFVSFDGLVISIKSAEIDEKVWAQFSYSMNDSQAESEEAKSTLQKQLADLNSRTGNWVYALPTFKANQLRRSLADLIIDENAETPPEQPTMPPGMMPQGMEGMMGPGGMPAMPPMQ